MKEKPKAEIYIKDKIIFLITDKSIKKLADYDSFIGIEEQVINNKYVYGISLRPMNAFILRFFLKRFNTTFKNKADINILTSEANKVSLPKAFITEDSKNIELSVPFIYPYKKILSILNAYPLKNGNFRINNSKILDLETLNDYINSSLPSIQLDPKIIKMNHAPFKNFDGTLNSLKNININELNIVKSNSQTYKSLSNSSKTLEIKLNNFGICNLYDLFNWLPKRYIDKSNPQQLNDLIVDETATIIGTITDINYIPGNKGITFIIETNANDTIPVTFWSQNWLDKKFKVGMEVVITGKMKLWRNKKQLNGNSIEDSSEAAILPIVPIYKQSESKGITTTLLLSAVREMFLRLGPINLPKYLERENRINYYDAFKELHLPTNLGKSKKVINSLAYYELVYLQLLIQDEKKFVKDKLGIIQNASNHNLQEKAIRNLPFTLTNGQVRAIENLNKKLADDKPSSTLLSAEVGSGKTLIAQLSALQSVDSGYQVLLLAPTDILAQQLFKTYQKIIDGLNKDGENIEICFVNSKLKVKEKREIFSKIEDGRCNIIVGTSGAMSDNIKYNNLGYIIIDEQQKFGAAQRSKLLNSREDKRIPDLMMQSATPIPRSTAQIFYGDIDLITVKDKPAGRLPIITEWVREDPNVLLEQMVNNIWDDVRKEAEKGNQTFIITPLVLESEKIDATSVEKTFKIIKENILPDLNIGFLHGQMKPEQQRQTMEDFRDKKYDVVVASTVVEVGVDIPDATRMIVLSAERLGASSLHQIRGRVGRNSKQSKCYLVSLGLSEKSQIRLQALVDNENGFEVAKIDLLSRGEGKLFGSEQSGASEMMFASLSKHSNWIDAAKKEAINILNSSYYDEAIKDAKEKFDNSERLV